MCIGIRSKQEQEQIEHVYDLAKLQKQMVWGSGKNKAGRADSWNRQSGKSPVLHEFLLLAGKRVGETHRVEAAKVKSAMNTSQLKYIIKSSLLFIIA